MDSKDSIVSPKVVVKHKESIQRKKEVKFWGNKENYSMSYHNLTLLLVTGLPA